MSQQSNPAPQLSFGFDQRWSEGREFRLPHDQEIFRDNKRYSVDRVPARMAKAFVEAHHYCPTWPTSVVAVGLWYDQQLVGLANFGIPVNEASIPHWSGLSPREGLELNRFVLLPSVPWNGESWFLARAIKGLATSTAAKVVLSYSDPVERVSRAGQLIMPGHIGTIYQASNAIYAGRSAARVKWFASNGALLESRAMSKFSTGAMGADYAERALREATGVIREAGETPKAYLDRLKQYVTRFRHPGNLVYLLPIEPKLRKTLEDRYPFAGYPKGNVLLRAA